MKDIKYIFKRILIGTGIALLLGTIRNTFAMELYTAPIGQNSYTITEGTTSTIKSVSGNPYSNLGTGYLHFSFSVNKFTGSSTSNIVVPRLIMASSGGSDFICDTGTVSTENSTFTGISFSATCPIRMGSQGLTSVSIFFSDFPSSQSTSGFYLIINSPTSFEKNSDATNFISEMQTQGNATRNTINNATSQASSSINSEQQTQGNATRNTINNAVNNIINNQNSQNQQIIDNQNQNTEKEIESQKSCVNSTTYKFTQGKNLNMNNGISFNSSDFSVSEFISLSGVTNIYLLTSSSASPNRGICFYSDSSENNFISCVSSLGQPANSEITIPSNANFARISMKTSSNIPTYKLCFNGNQAIVNSSNSINNTINDDSVDNEQASSFFDDFQADSHGLSGIITAPLRLIESLSSSSCSSLVLPLPFVNQNATLPCMSTVYNQFPTFYSLWQLITTGMIAYYILIKLFGNIKGLQNPDDDRIEVLNL